MSQKMTYLVAVTLAAGFAFANVSFAPDAAAEQVRSAPVTDDPQAQAAERERRVRARTERAKREAEFNQLDRDGDGYLSKDELAAKEDLSPGPDELDRDNDGLISRTEFAAVETSSVGPETSVGGEMPDRSETSDGAESPDGSETRETPRAPR